MSGLISKDSCFYNGLNNYCLFLGSSSLRELNKDILSHSVSS